MAFDDGLSWSRNIPTERGYYLFRRHIKGRPSFPTCIRLDGGVWMRPTPVAEPGSFAGACLTMVVYDAVEPDAEFFGPIKDSN